MKHSDKEGIITNSRTCLNITWHFCYSYFLYVSFYFVIASNSKLQSLHNMARLLPLLLAVLLNRLQLKVGQGRC